MLPTGVARGPRTAGESGRQGQGQEARVGQHWWGGKGLEHMKVPGWDSEGAGCLEVGAVSGAEGTWLVGTESTQKDL